MGFNDEDGFTPNWRNADEGFGGSPEASNGIDGNFARHEAFARELRRFAFSGDVDSGTDSNQQDRTPSGWGGGNLGGNAFDQAQLGQVKQFQTFLKAGDAQYEMTNEANGSTVPQFGQGLLPPASSPDGFTARNLNSGEASGNGAGQQPGQSAEVPVPPSPQENGRGGQDRETWEKMKGLDQETQTYLHGPRWSADGTITSPYDYRTDPFTGKKKFHSGIDIKNPEGGTVVASESGTVIRVTPGKNGENQVYVKNRDGTTSMYIHTEPSVKYGQKVYAGDNIGTTDRSGRSTGAHLHYQIHDSNGNHFDPTTKLPKRK